MATTQEHNSVSNSNELDGHLEQEKPKKNPPIPYKKIADLYNENIGDDFPKIQVYDSKDRKALIKKFWGLMRKDLVKVEAYFRYFGANATEHQGGANGWTAGPEFIMREDTITRARENRL